VIGGEDDLAGTVAKIAGEGDYVVCLGAGSISQWAAVLPEGLERVRAGEEA
jgi:UDP-N-acetylmuramate--alanine ligase